MSLHEIRKRNGDIVPFDRVRIEKAIAAAARDALDLDTEFITVVTDSVIQDIGHIYGDIFVNRTPGVEDIQDIVERNLMKVGKYEVAKQYILYRAKHQEKREEKQEELVEQFEKNKLQVTKSNGEKEHFDIEKIRTVFTRAAKGYENQCSFDALMEAFKKNIVEDIKTSDINKLLVKTCIDLVSMENIAWQEIAGRIFLGNLYKQASNNRKISVGDLYSPQSYLALVKEYSEKGLYSEKILENYSEEDILEAGRAIVKETDMTYGYTTVLSLGKRYLLNPNKVVKELPQEMYMSVALFLAIPEPKENRLAFAKKVYEQCSTQKISLPTPTLLNARTKHNQLSSCFKINVDDDLRSIYHSVENMAQISKFGGGVGVYLGNIRSSGGSIRGIYGAAGGVNPWIKVINDTAIAVNQLGARLGSISVTLDVWHRDIYDFLDLQTETGDIRAKAFDVFPAVSMPDLFMKRVKEN